MATERIQRRIERLLDQIEEAMDRLDWGSVRDHAQALLRLDPENVDALTYLAAAERDPVEFPNSSPPGQSTPTPSEVGSAQPASFADGRYQVKRFLGEGGKKKVYLAHDTTLDREVAFALIKTEGLDETSRTRIQREAQAMGRLGSHAHIVTVFDLGEEQGQPYMVTELMGGGDVEGAVEDAENHRLPLEQAVKIAQETCRGMEFAHSRGIVHRDLKPGNVWITSDGIAKIGDFGLAVALDRSRLTTEGMMVGTVSYMPPEQAMGGEVTPRSDLYSLGAMLYEMVTGRPPFLGDDSVAIIGQHINTPPVAPTWHNGRCPRALDALILRLLAKDPSERPESASDVLSALDAIDLFSSSEQPAADAKEAHALDSLAGGIFVGRQEEMGDLKAALENALSGRGQMVTLVGEPGIGKTRTAQELATYAGLRSAQVLWGRCYEEQGAPPYWPWVQAIRSYVRQKEPEELRSEMGAGAEDIAEIVSDVREMLPGLRTPPQLEPEQARFRLFDSVTAFLKAASQHRPLVLVLDDLHWADHPSLLLLEFVARELSGSRLLLVGTYRDMELSRRHPLSLTLGELTRERLFQRVLLRGLSQEDVGRFIELVSGIAPPRGMVEAVHRQTEGNPLFVTEVVRLLVQEGIVGVSRPVGTEPLRDSDTWSVRIPEGVREVIGRRLDRLSERCNETLTLAAVIGREFTLEQLKPLVEDMTEDRLLEVLEEALAARVIEELPRVVGRYQFTHALIQETLAGELSTTRKVRLHARIAEALEELYSDNIAAHAAELAHHFAEAQTVLGTEKLIVYSSLAGERALAIYAYEEALVHIQRALTAKEVPLTGSQPAQDIQEADLLFGLVRAQLATLEFHELHEAVVTIGRAFEYYAASGEIDRAVAVAEVPFIGPPGHRSGVAGLLARALALVPPDSQQAGRLLSRYSRVLAMEEGDDEGSRKAFDGAMAIARQEGDTVLEMRTWAVGAEVDMNYARRTDALEKALRALGLARDSDDPIGEHTARFFAVLSLRETGDPEEAERHATAALDVAERLKDRTRVAFALHANESINSFRGNWDAARSYSDRGLISGSFTPVFLGMRAHLEYEIGGSAQGDTNFESFLEIIRGIPLIPGLLHAHAALAIPLIGRIIGRLDDADLARQVAEVVISSPHAPSALTGIARAGLALLETLEGHISEVRKHYEELKIWQGATVHFVALSGDRLLGILAQAMGETGQAEVHFEDALVFCRKAGYRPELAWTCCDYADLLRERDGNVHKEKAMSLLDESLAISSALGMRPLMERVLSRREILRA